MQRTQQQWLELIEAQISSDLSIVDFCRQHDIPVKYFYSRRSDFMKENRIPKSPSSSFVKVELEKHKKGISLPSDAFVLTVGSVTLNLPSNIDAVWLSTLMAEFS